MNRLLTNYLRNGTIDIYVCFTFCDKRVTKKHCGLYLRVIFLRFQNSLRFLYIFKYIINRYNLLKFFLTLKETYMYIKIM